MHTQHIRSVLISLAIALCTIGGAVSVTYAQGEVGSAATASAIASISYPIAELGSCKNQQDCMKYCDDGAHMSACVAFAEKQGLLTGEDLRRSKLVAEKIASKQTPGACTTQAECETYCNGNVEHLNECVAFGEELGVIGKDDLAEVKKIAQALKEGAKMPGSCKSKSACETYCAVGAHIEECLAFAEKSGILPPDRLAEARKIAPFMKAGETPGKCDSKASCEAYCTADENFAECLGFAEKVGFVSGEDAAVARKTGGKGPGSCKSKEQCESYCNDEAHAAECLAFAKDNGLLSDEQKDLVENGMDQLKTALASLPDEARPQVTACLVAAAGSQEKWDRLLSKQDTPTKAIGDKIQGCFGKVSEIMQKAMSEKYGQQGAAGSPPSREEMMKNLPSNIPPEARAKIEEQIQAGGAGQGTGVVTPGAPGGAPTGPSCDMFANVPSCEYVPAGQGRDACLKCK